MLRGHLDLTDVHQIEVFPGELSKLRLLSGDLLIVEGNGSQSEIGRMAIWRGEIENCVHQNHIIRVRATGGIVPQYVETYWNSRIGASRVLGVASSTSGLYTLSVRKVSALPVPLPPFAEQQRIVTEVERRLSVIQQAEATVEANLARAERLRQSILKQRILPANSCPKTLTTNRPPCCWNASRGSVRRRLPLPRMAVNLVDTGQSQIH